jgi:hypothetical protein
MGARSKRPEKRANVGLLNQSSTLAIAMYRGQG